ncbi:MAG: CinA family protein [Lachnospiraceae bacterium]|nr:CinA family protein [Lachnospiraceae bacterium]
MDVESISKRYLEIVNKLIEKKLTVSLMESCTGGLIASFITDNEGSSSIFKGSFVTYSNEAKIKQGVPSDVIETYSVYSKETAKAMAGACKSTYSSDIGIGVTGTFGNTDPANPDASVPGQVYYAIDYEGQCQAFLAELPINRTRKDHKLLIADMIAQKLKGLIY